ncbi:helix-turn-helix domain-containing protein [Deinococcus lacus]|uniref:Helix-turn-helix domain-containing protein n=1 Tax=Deinococcus lacus TaxID=392561 RepID=A0ABW1YDA8_9DEIO
MKGSNSSRLVANAQQAVYLLSLKHRPILQALMQGPCSAGELTEAVQQSMNDVYYRLKQLERIGLVKVSEQVNRKGRPIKIYSSVAEIFVVPFRHTREETVYDFLFTHLSPIHDNFLQQVEKRLRENDVDIDSGFEFKVVDGKYLADFTIIEDSINDDIVATWEMVKISRAKADEFARKMLDIIENYKDEEGDNYMVGFYLVRTDTQTVRG